MKNYIFEKQSQVNTVLESAIDYAERKGLELDNGWLECVEERLKQYREDNLKITGRERSNISNLELSALDFLLKETKESA